MIARALLLLAIAPLLAAPVLARGTATGSGHEAIEERSVSGYHGISISVPAQVELRQGSREGVTLTADDNLLPLVETSVERGVLRVRFRRDLTVRPRTPIRIVVRATAIDSIGLAGNVRLQSAHLDAPRLQLNLAGASSVTIPELAVEEVALRTSGHCHAMLGGHAGRLELRMSGAGEANTVRLEAREASMGIVGSAEVATWVRERLKVDVVGSGAVRYFGDPAVTRAVSGSGRIERLGLAPP